MKLASTVVFLALSLGVARASDFVGVYALVDKVTLEPTADNPQRIQISGVFSMANPDDRNAYLRPQRGYLYFTLPPEKPYASLALKEWSDLKAAAGTHKVVSFGDRNSFQKLRVRKPDEKLASPDVYPTAGVGLTQNRSDTDYAPIKSLLEFPGS